MSAAIRILLPVLCLFFAATGSAAPLPPFPPVDLTGTVTEAQWVPEQRVEGTPGMSGSAGHDRVFPAHFIVRLARYSGVDSATAWQMTRLVDWHALDGFPADAAPPFIVLQIDHPDQGFLRAGMKIRATGYAIRGDEGGTWTSHDRITILPPSPQ